MICAECQALTGEVVLMHLCFDTMPDDGDRGPIEIQFWQCPRISEHIVMIQNALGSLVQTLS